MSFSEFGLSTNQWQIKKCNGPDLETLRNSRAKLCHTQILTNRV